MIRNLISWLLVAVFAVAFCGFISGCQSDNTEDSAKLEQTPPAEKEPAVVEEPPAVEESPVVIEEKPVLPKVSMATDLGEIVVELNPEKAPITVENFLRYVKEGFYDGLVFHRVWPGFMIQGGGFTPDMMEKQTHLPIKNEANNGLSNIRGTIAMARQPQANSATSQFFINVVDNIGLDYGKNIKTPAGYAVFGKVTKGMEVVDAIVKVPSTTKYSKKGKKLERNPIKPVVIKTIKVVE